MELDPDAVIVRVKNRYSRHYDGENTAGYRCALGFRRVVGSGLHYTGGVGVRGVWGWGGSWGILAAAANLDIWR